jgi:hypothetical protein
MAAKSAVGVTLCLTKGAASVANDISPTTVTAVAAAGTTPAGVSIAGTGLTVAVGEVVKFPSDFGFASLNGKAFVITATTGATGFTIGNVTLGTGTMKVGAKISHWPDTEMQCECWSAFSVASSKPSVISTATYCDPSASIPSAKSEAGTASVGGFIDITDAGYQLMLAADADAAERILRVKLGASNGYLVVPVTVSAMSYTLPIDGAQAYSAELIFSAKPVHVF